MPDSARSLRVRDLHEHGADDDLSDTTAADRLSMMWQLALDAWAFKEQDEDPESRLPRHIVSVQRRAR
jgi:hypothetical protein